MSHDAVLARAIACVEEVLAQRADTDRDIWWDHDAIVMTALMSLGAHGMLPSRTELDELYASASTLVTDAMAASVRRWARGAPWSWRLVARAICLRVATDGYLQQSRIRIPRCCDDVAEGVVDQACDNIAAHFVVSTVDDESTWAEYLCRDHASAAWMHIPPETEVIADESLWEPLDFIDGVPYRLRGCPNCTDGLVPTTAAPSQNGADLCDCVRTDDELDGIETVIDDLAPYTVILIEAFTGETVAVAVAEGEITIVDATSPGSGFYSRARVVDAATPARAATLAQQP